jgi:hypothetical protein
VKSHSCHSLAVTLYLSQLSKPRTVSAQVQQIGAHKLVHRYGYSFPVNALPLTSRQHQPRMRWHGDAMFSFLAFRFNVIIHVMLGNIELIGQTREKQ